MIAIKNLEKSFGKNKVLKGVDLEVKGQGIFAILGPNGSGKTTIIKSILGMVLPDAGEIVVGAEGVKGNWNYRKNISYLPQIAHFPENLKVKELLRMVKDIRGQEGNEQPLIERFKLEGFMNSRLRNLSGGTRQKVNIVLCFMFNSPYIILDEPTSGLDPVAMITLRELIQEERAKGKVILLTTHIMDIVEEMADEIVFLLEGKIFFKGSLQDMRDMTGEMKLERSIANILLRNDKQYQEVLTT
ncbi:ABC transporter ATP-binding protein [Fulvivirga kasyanovii]|uniref:ABC transporter ATP-binding protein n=1 Tax=Fulvivirga kasyanovii TaxID=396812 RepID=A0ABW9RU30_9BACT|nr:ABC transporter ATP-binding protein [Fulvivirga kasyanovii]MTI27207.1 ABC transporter ATP-binding protein [Fulvivirga kasyanovii]